MNALMLVMAMMTSAGGQSAGAAVSGTWTAAFEGRTFVRLELKEAAGAIAGGLAIGDIEVDKQGLVRKAGALPQSLTPIFDVIRRGAMMTFSRKDGRDTDQFELRFLDKDRAELRFLPDEDSRKELAASGIPLPKPIALTRQ